MSPLAPKHGRLHGVGIGPGDPDLLTVKAAKLIGSVPVIAYFAKKGGRGKARTIIDSWIGAACEELPLAFPLTTEMHFCDPRYIEALRGFYDASAETIAEHLTQGRDVALVCEGDPFFYGSFMHVYIRLKDRFSVSIIPGISGMAGCWSAAGTPITWGDDVLTVRPGTLAGASLAQHLVATDAAVIIKIGANLAKIRAAIAEAGRSAEAIYVEHGTMEAEKILPLAQKTDDAAPYFSIILIPGQGRRP